MRLTFARHGESEANLLQEISNRGWRHPLTETGRAQARALADALRGLTFARIYSSPLMRAVQTAEIVSGALGVPLEVADALREYDCGAMEGRADAEAWQAYNAALAAWVRGDWDARIEGGESLNDMRVRLGAFVERLVRAYPRPEDNVLLVTHGGLLRCTLPQMVSNLTFAFTLEKHILNTATVVVEARPERLTCLEWCGQPVGMGS